MEDQQRRSFMAFLKLFSSLGMLNISSFSKSNVRNVTRGVSNPPDDNTPPPTYQSRLMTFFTNVSHLWNTWWEKYAPIRKLIINNKLASSFCLMICFSFISFLPLLYYGNGYNSTFLSKNPQYHVIFSDNYKTWLLVSIAVAIPMVIEAVLDYSIVCNNTVEFKNWLSRVTLVGALVIPNVILYFLVAQNSSEIEPYLPQIQFSIFFSQQIIIIGSLFGTMYEHRWDNVMNPNDRLNISIEERTVYFLLTATIAKVFICFSVLFSNAYQPLYVIAAFTSVFAVLQIIYMLIKSMRFLANQTDCNYQFNSHHHMSDFCHLMAALIFIITDFVLLITSQRLLDIDPNVTINYRYTLYITEFLYIQVALTYFLTVIPSRSYLLHAEIQKDKLNTRLNLIRYVSHEMRTPLNTAFLGLAMLLSDLKNVFKKYKERTMALKESARHSDKTGAVGGGRSDNSRGLGKPNFSKAAAPPSPSNRVESKSKDESDSELPVHPFPTQHHNNPRQDFRTLSVSNDERENHLIHPELATPQSHVTVIDDEKLQNLLFTKTEASASDIQHRQHSQSSNLQDWFFDRKFVEIFIQGLKSIVSMDTVEDMIDTVNQIHESCKVALDTLNDLLMFDKIDENKLIVEVEEIDPWILLCDTAKPFEINAKDANVSFTISCTDADSNWTFATFIKADKFKLSQVIRNLISNSLKFTPSLGTVKVKLEKLPIRQSSIKDCIDTNIAIRITVEDNGAGISLENQKKLFGQYVQFNAAQLQQGKGSGLGLWISRSIIEMHGGKINAISAGEGKGSSFYIDLPLFTNERSQSVNFFGSADSAESALTYRSRIPVFRRGLGVNGLSTGNLKRIPSLLNKPVILMANSTRDLESAHPSIPLNSVLSAEISNPDLLRHQQTMRSIPERKGPTPPPTGTMPLHVPDLKLHKDAPLFDEVDTAARDRDLETANSVLLEEDEEEEEEEDTGGWMDHLKRMFRTPSQSSARLVGRPSWGSSKKRRKRKTSLLVSRILPSASFLSSSSSNYSLPHFVKDKKQPNSSAVEMQQHLPSPNTPVMLDESLQHFRSIGELHQPKATPERSITVENLQSLIDSEEEDLGSLLSSPNLSSTAINMTSESYNYNQQKLRDNYYKLENIPSVDELDEDSSIVENKSIDGRKATGSSHTRDENVIIFAPLSADTRDDASLLLPVANLGTFASAPSLTSLTSVTQTQVDNVVNADGNGLSGKRRKVRIEIAELGSRSSDVSPTNRSARIHMQISSKKLIHYDSKLDSLYPTRTSPTALSRNGTVKAPVKSWEGGLNILIVDDSSPNRKMLKKLLSSCNHTVYEAKDGLECLELLDYATEEGKGTRSAVGLIDVVLMDDHMPRLTGPEATSLLKSRGFPGVIYAVSGTVDQNEIDHFLSSGVEAIFAKPLNVEALKISINEYYLSNTEKL